MMQRNYGRVDDAMPLLDETRARLSVGVFEENEMLHKKIVRGSRNDLHKLVEVLHLLRVDTSGALDQEGSLCKVQRLGSAFKLELDVRNLSECSLDNLLPIVVDESVTDRNWTRKREITTQTL